MIKNYLLKILDIDSDGNTTAKIIDKKLRNTEVFIPYNKQNPVIKIGDTVKLWDFDSDLSKVSEEFNTISYNLLTNISSRVTKNYLE